MILKNGNSFYLTNFYTRNIEECLKWFRTHKRKCEFLFCFNFYQFKFPKQETNNNGKDLKADEVIFIYLKNQKMKSLGNCFLFAFQAIRSHDHNSHINERAFADAQQMNVAQVLGNHFR